MIHRQEDGDLSWPQEGHVITVSPAEVAQYSPALATEDMQNNAAHQNTANKNAYTNTLAIAQENVNASRPIPGVPEKPAYIIVSDPVMKNFVVTPGVQSEGEWPPPGLPDLQHKMIYGPGGKLVEEPFVIEKPATEPPTAEPKHKK